MFDLGNNLQAGFKSGSRAWKGALLGAALLYSGAAVAHPQARQQTAPNAPVPAQAEPAKPPAKPTGGAQTTTPAPSDDNAFPLAASEAAQKKAQAAQDATGASDSNAFPEAKSEAAENRARDGKSNGTAPAENGEPYSSSRTRAGDLNDLLGTNQSPVSDGAGHYIKNDKLAKEDMRVGTFYLDQGNYAGAYMRLKEATEVAPGNVEAVYLLAEAARKSSHLDEAEKNYQLYLEVKPDGKYAKDSMKALREMAGK